VSERSDYYVYALFHPDDRDFAFPRYIGKGWGMRVVAHRTKRARRVAEWIAEMGDEPLFDIIAANMTETAAYALEVELIAKYGREGLDEGGVLKNVALGGPGARGVKVSPDRLVSAAQLAALADGRAAAKARFASMSSVERKARAARGLAAAAIANRGRKYGPMSAEHRAAISAAKKGKPTTAAQLGAVAKAAAANRGRKRSIEHCMRLRGPKHSADARAKMSAANKGKPKSLEHRAALSAAAKDRATQSIAFT
jgi:hypothetical protein